LNPAQIIRLSQFVGVGIEEGGLKETDGYSISPIAFTLPYSKNLITYNQQAIKQLGMSHS
jgi:hypothetical protein